MADLLHKALRRVIERPGRVYHWGSTCAVTPRLCERVFGDGRKLIHITPLNSRPNYYVLRIDSSWSLTSDDFHDHLDDLYGALEDEFGTVEDGELEAETARREWPALDLDAGTSWGRISWPKMHRRPRVVRRFGSQVLRDSRPNDARYELCLCPGCGMLDMKRPLEESDDYAMESYCNECGYEVTSAPYRLPSVRELVEGKAGAGWSSVDLGRFVPALLKALTGKQTEDP